MALKMIWFCFEIACMGRYYVFDVSFNHDKMKIYKGYVI